MNQSNRGAMHEQTLGRVDNLEEDAFADSALDLRVRELLETLPVGAYTCDPDGLITYYNQRAVELWGRTPKLHDPEDRWCGSFKLFTPDGTPLPHEACWMALAIKTGQPQNGCEIVVERPDGEQLLVLAHANPIRDDEGRLLGALNVVVDITDRRRSEEATSRLGAIVESSDDAIISKSLEGKILSWNGGAERLFGYRAEEAVGHSITLIIPPELRHEEGEILAKLRRGQRVDHYETVRVRKDGRRVDISLTSSPVRDGSGKVIGASKVARDISARKQDERALKQVHAELRAADEAKNNFLATLSHELRNPLAPIRNTVETLHQMVAPTPELRAALGVIDRQLRQMTRLIDDLLDVSRITNDKLELRKERLDLADVLHAAVEAARPLLTEQGHQFSVELPPEPLLLDADLARLAQVVANLLNNAAKYTERGGQIRLAARRQGASAEITVRDSGVGIPADMRDKIFERFAQIGRSPGNSHGGLGIGLHLAKRLVEMHDGTLSVRSDGVGQGSEFTVRLPLPATSMRILRATTEEDASMPAIGTLRILVVDDNRDAADSLGMVLSLSGNLVHIAYDGTRALEMIEEFRPDAVLLDIGLPKVDGYQVAQRIRAQPWGGEIRLIALTGWGQEEAKQRSKEAGFDAHLVKPADPRELMRQLATLRRRAATQAG